MKQVQSDRDFFPDYPATLSFVRKLACEYYSSEHDGNALGLHYSNPKGLLTLTLEELMTMNQPDFITRYQKDPLALTREDVLTAIKAEFGKEIKYMGKPRTHPRPDH